MTGPPAEAPNSLRLRLGTAKLYALFLALAMPAALLLRPVQKAEPWISLVPDFVVIMPVPGEAYCAPPPLASTLTSCTESGSGNWACPDTLGPPKLRFSEGAPSSSYSRASPTRPFIRVPGLDPWPADPPNPYSKPGVVTMTSDP